MNNTPPLENWVQIQIDKTLKTIQVYHKNILKD